jgi:hypothetical protein
MTQRILVTHERRGPPWFVMLPFCQPLRQIKAYFGSKVRTSGALL